MNMDFADIPRDVLAKKLTKELPRASLDLREAVNLLQSKPESEGPRRHDESSFQRTIGTKLATMHNALEGTKELLRRFAWVEDQAHNPVLRRVASKVCEVVDFVTNSLKPERNGGTVPEDNTLNQALQARALMKDLFRMVA